MAEIILKAINQNYVLMINEDFDQFLIECVTKLKMCCQLRNPFSVFFDCSYELSDEQLTSLLECCGENGTILLGKWETPKPTQLVVIEKVYPGSVIECDEDTLILCDVGKDCFVQAKQQLYILGKVKGSIEMSHSTCKVSAASFEEAKVRIFDSNIQNVTSFTATTLYYEQGKVCQL